MTGLPFTKSTCTAKAGAPFKERANDGRGIRSKAQTSLPKSLNPESSTYHGDFIRNFK
jgi:hypothetical protein